ncbi:dihydrofolate reductase [Erysipelothrix urinaevulpis]|uniref:dihydrofolate reductase n=1 Tax=Erysipelothrix urinaevulpis TaxID=2683717 RepID=UPI00135C8DF2|nr:dihydrofolate reductase [Erysipelothrix urinaevulpis]
MFKIIVAVNKKNVIGKDGSMPWHNPEDLSHFRKTTLNQTLIMGRKTLEGLPKKLDKRSIYAVSRNPLIENRIADISTFLKEHEDDEQVYYVAGGAEIYRLALPYVQTIILSRINDESDGDTYFPASWLDGFSLDKVVEHETFAVEYYSRKEEKE